MRGRKFADAKRELLYAVGKLDKSQFFYVIFFDYGAKPMFAGRNTPRETRALAATRENVQRLKRWLPSIENGGQTNPFEAVQLALELMPDAIFILSDGEFTDGGQTERFLAANNVLDDPLEGRRPKTVVHTIAFHSRAGEPTMQAIAERHGGTYEFVAR
jgi:hypothetical protein